LQFEVAMHRDKYPEKVPFRLTRMLIHAMEVSGIEGTYRSTCENVMRVMRDNKESLMAVLEAFVHDPLITWRLLAPASPAAGGIIVPPSVAGGKADDDDDDDDELETEPSEAVVAAAAAAAAERKKAAAANDDDATTAGGGGDDDEEAEDEVIPEVLNERALQVINRVQNKLTGRDFGPSSADSASLDVAEQVQRLITQATSHENLAQLYIGWCSSW
jgi:serine/threonine-protein kinase mTOR